jgi:hypothetical protein
VSQAGWVSLATHAFWPVAALVMVAMLRRQIGEFLSAVGTRITRLSVMKVTIELAVTTEASPPWQGRQVDVRGLVSAQQVNDSYFDTLRQSLQIPGDADFFSVHLKRDGTQQWLTTRLYLFTYLLSRLKGVRAVVFTATRGDVSHCFLGVAPAEAVLRALAAAEPWHRLARRQLEAKLPNQTTVPPPPAGSGPPADGTVAEDVDEGWEEIRVNPFQVDPLYLAQQFIEHVQWIQSADMGPGFEPPGWLRLPDAPGRPTTWEHASWITAVDLTDGMLSGVVRSDSFVVDDRSWTPQQRVCAAAQTPGDFVAFVGPTRQFERLVDRRSLLEALGADAAKA